MCVYIYRERDMCYVLYIHYIISCHSILKHSFMNIVVSVSVSVSSSSSGGSSSSNSSSSSSSNIVTVVLLVYC